VNLIERARATQKTVDLFKGKVFDDGKFDCIQMVVAHARHAGKRIRIPAYGDVTSAAAVLRELGFRTLGEAMDAHFDRILPTTVLLGDYIEMPGGNGFSSLSIVVGNGRVLGYVEGVPHADILQPVMISGAWSLG
jgi:hypothetical protein